MDEMSYIAVITCDHCGTESRTDDRFPKEWLQIQILKKPENLQIEQVQWDLCPECSEPFIENYVRTEDRGDYGIVPAVQARIIDAQKADRDDPEDPRCTYELRGNRCCLDKGHGGDHHYKCASPNCPGYFWLASERPHPTNTCTG